MRPRRDWIPSVSREFRARKYLLRGDFLASAIYGFGSAPGYCSQKNGGADFTENLVERSIASVCQLELVCVRKTSRDELDESGEIFDQDELFLGLIPSI